MPDPSMEGLFRALFGSVASEDGPYTHDFTPPETNVSDLKMSDLTGYVCGHQHNGVNGELRITNTLDRVSTCPCDQCQQWVTDGDQVWLGGGRTDLVPTLLGFCGCGAPDTIDEQFYAYLNGTAEWWAIVRADEDDDMLRPITLGGKTYPPRPDTDYLTMYLCDALGWTEHGGSVGGAWLTDEGERALSNLRALLADPEETP